MRALRDQQGFTLIELIVVIVVMGFIGGVVLVRRPWHSVGLDTEATVRALTSALHLARSRAIVQDREISIVTDASGFRIENESQWSLPVGEALTPGRMTFLPDGGSYGATIVLAAGPRRISILVNWLTGRVLVQEEAAG